MGRYFVVLNGTRSGVVYVVAEVVREPNDDGLDREMSLAGNLAGSLASIVTEDELRHMPGGRVALERWRSANDTSFVLDTIAHDFDTTRTHGDMDVVKPATLDEAHQLLEESRGRSREMLSEAAAARENSNAIRETLRATLAKVNANREKTADLLDAIGEQIGRPDPPAKRRHLRSVS